MRTVLEHCSRDQLAFARYTQRGFVPGWWNRALTKRLRHFSVEVSLKLKPRLMVFAPPRHGKSELASVKAPVHHMGNNPSDRVVCASYASSLANQHSKSARALARGPRAQTVFPGLALPPPRRGQPKPLDQIAHWQVGDPDDGGGGTYKAIGVGGGLSGFGANYFSIDDPFKDLAAAGSQGQRDAVWDWWRWVARTRMEPGAGAMVTLTRWNVDDIAGRLEDGGGWDIFSHPAIALEDTYIGEELVRRAGEALHPERWSIEELEEIRADIGPRAWAALFQQTPVPDEGTVFEPGWVHYYDEDPRKMAGQCDYYILSTDPTFRKTTSGSYFTVQVWGVKMVYKVPFYYLLGQFRQRVGYTAAKGNLRNMRLVDWPRARKVLIELRALGDALAEDLADIPGIHGIEPRNVANRKVLDAMAVSGLWEQGQVKLPNPTRAGNEWVIAFVRELLAFPYAAHDDQVDTMTQALNYLRPSRRKGKAGKAIARAFAA